MVSSAASGHDLDAPDLPLGVHGVLRYPLTEPGHAVRAIGCGRDHEQVQPDVLDVDHQAAVR